MAEVLATVAILTFNGDDYLEELLEAVASQQIEGEFETLVIDSGSTDETLSILARHPEVRVIEIPNSEFGHGRTRQLAAREAKGSYVAYLTQDAIPDSDGWLTELLAPFRISERVALVTGRQTPRARAFPLQKYEIIGVFDGLGPRYGTTIYGAAGNPLSEPELAAASFHSDVNAAVRRELVLGELQFRDVRYAEDQLMGRDVLDAGWLKAYAGRACVVHSNDLTRAEYGHRIFDETVGLRQIGTNVPPLSRGAQVKLTVRGVLGDSLRIARDREFTTRARLSWLVRNPAYQGRKWSSYRSATRVDISDADAVAAGSLESRRAASGG